MDLRQWHGRRCKASPCQAGSPSIELVQGNRGIPTPRVSIGQCSVPMGVLRRWIYSLCPIGQGSPCSGAPLSRFPCCADRERRALHRRWHGILASTGRTPDDSMSKSISQRLGLWAVHGNWVIRGTNGLSSGLHPHLGVFIIYRYTRNGLIQRYPSVTATWTPQSVREL